MIDVIKEFIKPELVGIIPVLYFIGLAAKKSALSNWLIPWLLGMLSIVFCGLYLFATMDITGWRAIVMGVFTAVTQGVLLAGASVYVNQLVKQTEKK